MRPPQIVPSRNARPTNSVNAARQLRRALRGPLEPTDRWRDEVAHEIADLRRALADHVAITEGSAGLFEQIVDEAPRLAGPVQRLRDAHSRVALALAAASAAVDQSTPAGCVALRARLVTTLARVARHDREENELVFEAFEQEVGTGAD